MRTLITGVAGFIGSHLAERLVAAGTSVVGLDAFTDYYDPALKRANLEPVQRSAEFTLVEGNLRNRDLEGLLAGVDVVYHLAAQPGVRRSWGREFEIYVDENLLALQLLLEAVKGAGVERFVFASSSSIYGDAESFPTPESAVPRPVSPYGLTKLAGEHLCRLYFARFEMPIVSLRYFTVYGPRQRPDMAFTRFIEAAGEGREIEVFGDGRQSRDFTYVADAVDATMAAGSKGRPGAVYNVAGGSQATVEDVIARLEEIFARSIPVRHLPPVPGDARHTSADVASARRDLAYAPSVDLRTGLANQVRAQLPGAGRVDRDE